MNEISPEAVKCEVLEETRIHYEIERLDVIYENFFIGDGHLTNKKMSRDFILLFNEVKKYKKTIE